MSVWELLAWIAGIGYLAMSVAVLLWVYIVAFSVLGVAVAGDLLMGAPAPVQVAAVIALAAVSLLLAAWLAPSWVFWGGAIRPAERDGPEAVVDWILVRWAEVLL